MFIGLDLGTSGLKAVLVDAEGQVLTTRTVAVSTQRPYPLWVEQNPQEWWEATQQVFAELTKDFDLTGLQAIGIAGHMHGAVLLDVQGNVLRPCIMWNDGRSALECAVLEQAVPDFRARSGNLAMPGFTAPKVLWVQRHEPDVFAATAKVLLPKDYLRFCLTGEYLSDMSDAAGTLWLDPERRAWDDVLLAATGLSRTHMPDLVEGSTPAGSLHSEVASALGVSVVPVVGGAGDNAAGALGVGVIDPGDAFISLGTSGVYFVVSDQHHAAPEHTVHAFCHCLPQRWHQMSVMLSAASSLDWFAAVTGTTVADLLEELEDSGVRKTPVTFLPYLNGERTPHNDPLACAQFYGLTAATTRAQMTLAVLEGVAFSVADGEAALQAAATPIGSVSLIGGGARSARWRQILADVLQRPLNYRAGGDVGPGLGAARLAMLGVYGVSPATLQRWCPPPPLIALHEPDPTSVEYYQQQLARYRALYQATLSVRAALT